MNPVDAQLFKVLSEQTGYIPAINPQITRVDNNQWWDSVTPEWYLGQIITSCDIFQISTSLARLNRLGLISLRYDRKVSDSDSEYNQLINSDNLTRILQQCKEIEEGLSLKAIATHSHVYVNEFGKHFASCCL